MAISSTNLTTDKSSKTKEHENVPSSPIINTPNYTPHDDKSYPSSNATANKYDTSCKEIDGCIGYEDTINTDMYKHEYELDVDDYYYDNTSTNGDSWSNTYKSEIDPEPPPL